MRPRRHFGLEVAVATAAWRLAKDSRSSHSKRPKSHGCHGRHADRTATGRRAPGRRSASAAPALCRPERRRVYAAVQPGKSTHRNVRLRREASLQRSLQRSLERTAFSYKSLEKTAASTLICHNDRASGVWWQRSSASSRHRTSLSMYSEVGIRCSESAGKDGTAQRPQYSIV